jgi:hypothetical protein
MREREERERREGLQWVDGRELMRLQAIELAAREFASSVGIDVGHDGWARYCRLRKSLGLPER